MILHEIQNTLAFINLSPALLCTLLWTIFRTISWLFTVKFINIYLYICKYMNIYISTYIYECMCVCVCALLSAACLLYSDSICSLLHPYLVGRQFGEAVEHCSFNALSLRCLSDFVAWTVVYAAIYAIHNCVYSSIRITNLCTQLCTQR